MKIRLIPTETLAIITKKNYHDIYDSLTQKLNHRIGSTTKFIFPEVSDTFIIERTLNDRNRTVIIVNGFISSGETGNVIYVEATVRKNSVPLLAIILWYSVCLLFFLAFVSILIRDHEFRFFVFLPLVFMLLGYGMTTSSMQGAIDELIAEMRKAVK